MIHNKYFKQEYVFFSREHDSKKTKKIQQMNFLVDKTS